MNPIRSTDPQDALRDINPSRPPHGIPQVRWSRGMPEGKRESKTVAFMRGHQVGIYDAYLTVKQDFPEIADQLPACVRYRGRW